MNTVEFFYGRDHPLSQWYLSDFVIDNIRFNSAEQWMMYAKAMLFNDHQKAEEICQATDPSIQRRLGRQVRYYRESIWVEQCRELVYKGNHAKFSQNESLHTYLLETGDALLEASPTDLRWGIGLSADDPNRFDQRNWTGLNWLGQLLMRLRHELNIPISS